MAVFNENRDYEIKGDRALGDGDDDKLGFRDVAKRIAKSLVDRVSQDGLVIGIEGAWGSGKSSLVFLIGQEVERQHAQTNPTIISFRPWLVSSRDALIAHLFGELSGQLEKVSSDSGYATPVQRAKAKAALQALRQFVGGLSSVGSMIELAGEASGIIGFKYLGKGIKTLAKWSNGKPKTPQLSALKDNLCNALNQLGHRFIVIIDDVDRLEPSEVIEVLRLVRSVLDLPNIIYLLCYDRQILSQSIEHAAGVRSGEKFLEKIMQLTVMVPKPEPLQLRQWFTDELHLFASVKNDDERSRLKRVIDIEGERQLETPRSVIRALDAVRFFWQPISELQADLADLVWIQLVKEGNPKLYRWIEEYCGTASVLSIGIARIDDREKTEMHAKLVCAVPNNYFSNLSNSVFFSEQLPGVEPASSENRNEISIFEKVSEKEQREAIQGKRIASPDHYRLYFALAGPTHALTHADVTSVWKGTENGPEQVGNALLLLQDQSVAGSLSKADLFLERLKDGTDRALSSVQAESILLAFSRVLDEAYKRYPFDAFWPGTIWDRAKDSIPYLLTSLDHNERDRVLTTMFDDGIAIGWLTSILRDETFAHGLYGDDPRPEHEWLFSKAQMEKVTKLMLKRYQALSAEEFLDIPQPLSLLFAWRQAGDMEGARQFVSSNINTNEEFVRMLEIFLSTVTSSNRGVYKVLRKDNIEKFLDYERSIERINSLREDPELGDRANQLATAVKLDRSF